LQSWPTLQLSRTRPLRAEDDDLLRLELPAHFASKRFDLNARNHRDEDSRLPSRSPINFLKRANGVRIVGTITVTESRATGFDLSATSSDPFDTRSPSG
jgi:hypothetical protein